MNREYPAPGFRRMCEGVTGLTTPEWEREVHAFFRERKVDLDLVVTRLTSGGTAIKGHATFIIP